MSGWKKLLEEESQYQWISFACFAAIVIIGAILIDWSEELSGVHSGAEFSDKGLIFDSAGDATIYENETGRYVSLHGSSEELSGATCLVKHKHITFACLGVEGLIFFTQDDFPENGAWYPMALGKNVTATDLGPNSKDQLLVIIQDGTSDQLGVMQMSGGGLSNTTNFDDQIKINTIVETGAGWLVGGSWRVPSNWLGTNPASPPSNELVLHVEWDGVGEPKTRVVYTGGQGSIHGIYEVDGGFVATGTDDTVLITDDEIISYNIASHASVVDRNQNIWLFGGVNSDTVAIISDGEIKIEYLPDRLGIEVYHITCSEDGMISLYGTNTQDQPQSISIESDARSSIFSLRGILDLGFILVSIAIVSVMGWNIFDAIRKGEIF